MPIFQPTNIIPSSFAGIGSGCVDVSDEINISWQVNGNVPMTGFSIDILDLNDSTTVNTLSEVLSEPFYGTDSKGNPRFFSYNANGDLWSDYGLSNGNLYGLLITQMWAGGSISQLSPSVFITRSKPTLSIDQFSGTSLTVNSISQQFTADYAQAQGDGINWCRWQLFKKDGSNYQLIDDTGNINTADLSYIADGMFSRSYYSINCTVETQNGIIVSTGNQDFYVSYDSSATSSDISLSCKKDSSALIGLGEYSSIEGIPSSASYGQFSEGSLQLNTGESVAWTEYSNGDPIGFTYPFSLLYKGDITGFRKTLTDSSFSAVYAIDVYAPTAGTIYLFACGISQNESVLRSYARQSDGSFLKVSEANLGSLTLTSVSTVSVNYNGTYVSVSAQNGISVFPLSNGAFGTPIIPTNNGVAFSENDLINYSKFAENLSVLIVGGNFGTNVYSVSGQSATFLSSIIDSGVPVKSLSIATKAPFSGINYVAIGSSSAGSFIYLFTAASSGLTLVDTLDLAADPSTAQNLCSNICFGNVTTGENPYLLFGGSYSWGSSLIELAQNSASVRARIEIDTQSNTFTNQTNMSGTENILMNKNCWKISPGFTSSVLFSDGEGMYLLNKSTGSLSFLYNLRETSYEESPYNTPSCFFPISSEVFGYAVGSNQLYALQRSVGVNPQAILIDHNNGSSTFYSISYDQIGYHTDFVSGANFSVQISGSDAIICASPNINDLFNLTIYFFNKGELTETFRRLNITQTTAPISGITLNGYTGTEFLFVKSGLINGSDALVTPTPTDDTYFLTDFQNQSLIAASYASKATLSYLYRSENNQLRQLYKLGADSPIIKDFGLKSNVSYSYQLVSQNSAGIYTPVAVSNPICLKYNAYFLMEATQDPDFPNVYHVVNYWAFGSNLNVGSVTNNNKPTWFQNFTPYRYRQRSSQNGKSGTLQALLSNVNPQTLSYSETPQMQNDLFNASLSNNTFFLKDTTGNLMMVHISGPITQTTNIKSNIQEITVSVPWEEIGDASTISLIQTPNDPGWEG